MPKRLPDHRIDLIYDMLRQKRMVADIAQEVGVSRQCVSHYKGLYEAEMTGFIRNEYYKEPPCKAETDEQSRLFTAALNGQRYDQNVSTKSYGRVMRPAPQHIMGESMLARCG